MKQVKGFLLPNEPTCIAACTTAEARFWRSESRYGEWTALGTLENEEAGSSDRDLVSDRPGRSFDSFGSGRHAMAPRESAQETELKRFAKTVADWLDKAVAEGTANRVVLICDPRFLGTLRPALSAKTGHAVILEVPKNPGGLDQQQLRAGFT